MTNLLSATDLIIVPIILVITLWWARLNEKRHIEQEGYYQYFTKGLIFKFAGGLAFALVYLFYYGGGDTVYYFKGSAIIYKMAFKDFGAFLRLMAGEHSPELASMFDASTGYPLYYRDPNSFAVSRFNVPLYLLGFKSYLGNTLLYNLIIYFSIWRFYKLLSTLYPKQYKTLSIAFLFLPSILFWTSGILKDGFCFAAILQIMLNVYNLIIKRKSLFINVLSLIIWSYVAISIRPYSFYVTIGSSLIWISFHYLQQIKGRMLRTIALPLIILLSYSVGSLLILKTGSQVGDRYKSFDAMLETAQIIQDDLSKDYYGGNSFNIGPFEPTLPGIMAKFPKAVTAGVFRPFIWESRNPLMLLSGIEGLAILVFCFLVVIKYKLLGFFIHIYRDPLLLASFIFTITFAFFVGLTTANFGALVRYRTPVLPFLLLILIILRSHYKEIAAKEKKEMTAS